MKKTMNNNNTTRKTSFWNFLATNTIEIPIIQRDYAQGRFGKEYLRKSFLADIKKALNDDKTELKLDFVYGSVENGKLSPLDGQQRLTTLWLLHWYIALKSGNLDEDVCKILEKFTYETRISSREFCSNLCVKENFKDFDGNAIVKYITSRTWFYSAWKQDPTIQSMLRMLGGTEINDKNGEDIVDGLEELFLDTDKDTFAKYWVTLTKNDVIVFYQLPLENFGLSDDLYIKMNARGKQLTSFENFKADLVGYIREQAEDNQEWNSLLDAKNGIPIKMDTTWTDIFWKNKSVDNKIDEIFYAFLNRFFLCELVCQTEEKVENLEKTNSSFSYLYGDKGDDSKVKYEDLCKYKYRNREIPLTSFDFLKAILNNYTEDANKYFPEWVKTDFQFIPLYLSNTISTLGQKERVVFLAVCQYLKKSKIEEVSFKQWMRVVWNIVENSGIETIPAMVGAMRLIEKLSEHSHDIYTFLANYDEKKLDFAKDQVKEEIAKAKQILLNSEDSNTGFSEDEIIYAESHPLLKGCISTLFENDNCEKVSFGKNIKDRIELLDKLRGEDNDKDFTLVKVLISLYKGKPEGKLYLNKNQKNWKSLITDKLKECFRNNKDNTISQNCEGWQSMLANTNLIENSREDGKILGEYWGKIVLWAKSGCTWNAYGNVILDSMHNNKLLSELFNNQIIGCAQKINNCDFFWGWDINFNYSKEGNLYDFQWNTDGNVYLIENNERKTSFSVEGIDNVNAFEERLKILIEKYTEQ